MFSINSKNVHKSIKVQAPEIAESMKNISETIDIAFSNLSNFKNDDMYLQTVSAAP